MNPNPIMESALRALHENLINSTDMHVTIKEVADSFGIKPEWLAYAYKTHYVQDLGE